LSPLWHHEVSSLLLRGNRSVYAGNTPALAVRASRAAVALELAPSAELAGHCSPLLDACYGRIRFVVGIISFVAASRLTSRSLCRAHQRALREGRTSSDGAMAFSRIVVYIRSHSGP